MHDERVHVHGVEVVAESRERRHRHHGGDQPVDVDGGAAAVAGEHARDPQGGDEAPCGVRPDRRQRHRSLVEQLHQGAARRDEHERPEERVAPQAEGHLDSACSWTVTQGLQPRRQRCPRGPDGIRVVEAEAHPTQVDLVVDARSAVLSTTR